MIMKHIYLIRHGESSHNADKNRLSGSTDVSLTDEGINQCSSIAGYLSSLNIDQIIATPLARSAQSAEILFSDRKDEIRVDSLLVEFDYGDYEGIDPLTCPEVDPIISKWENDPSDLTFPNGGSIPEHALRVHAGLLTFMQNAPHDSYAFISHRTTMRLLVAEIMRVPLKYFRTIPCDNCAITKLEYNAGSLTLSMLNVTPTYLLKG